MTPSLINKNRTPTRARGERVYKPGGKKEWRVVFWTHESTKPSRRQCSFSEAKYGKEAASLLSRAVLDYIDVKGVVPDDLHDPPILDPAKKELIEYYSALHESRKALQKKNKPKGGSSGNKGSCEPSIVPLYTLAQSQSPTMTNISSGTPNLPVKVGRSEKSPGLAGLNDQFSAEIHTSFGALGSNSSSPNEPRVLSPLSTIVGTGRGLNTEESAAKAELETGDSNADNAKVGGSANGFLSSVQIPPIPNITSSVVCSGGANDGESEKIKNHASQHSRKSPCDLDGFNAVINNVISSVNKQSPFFGGGGGAHFALMGSIFPNQIPHGMQSPLQASFPSSGNSSILPDLFSPGYSGFLGPDLNHILSQACQQIALQNQYHFFNQLGYLNHLAGLTIAGIGGNAVSGQPGMIGGSLVHNFPPFHNQEAPSVANTARVGASVQRNVYMNGTLNSGHVNPSESAASDNRESAKTGFISSDSSAFISVPPSQQGGDSFSLSPSSKMSNEMIVSVPASAGPPPPLFA